MGNRPKDFVRRADGVWGIRDASGRFWPVDQTGERFYKRNAAKDSETSRPPMFSAHVWWKVYAPKDRQKWLDSPDGKAWLESIKKKDTGGMSSVPPPAPPPAAEPPVDNAEADNAARRAQKMQPADEHMATKHYWVEEAVGWTRVHVVKRSAFFMPGSVPGEAETG